MGKWIVIMELFTMKENVLSLFTVWFVNWTSLKFSYFVFEKICQDLWINFSLRKNKCDIFLDFNILLLTFMGYLFVFLCFYYFLSFFTFYVRLSDFKGVKMRYFWGKYLMMKLTRINKSSTLSFEFKRKNFEKFLENREFFRKCVCSKESYLCN